MSNFVGIPHSQIRSGCHGNHAFSHSPYLFFKYTLFSHSGGHNEQFGTHEKLTWRVQGNLNWMPGYD